MSDLEKVSELLAKHKTGDYDLDKACWAVVAGHGLPCPYYADPWFYDARQDPTYSPESRMTTDLSCALAWLQQNFEDCSWTIRREDGETHVKVESEHEGYILTAERRGEFKASDLALMMAQCTVEMQLSQRRIDADLHSAPGL